MIDFKHELIQLMLNLLNLELRIADPSEIIAIMHDIEATREKIDLHFTTYIVISPRMSPSCIYEL
jgi:hypothetical protein